MTLLAGHCHCLFAARGTAVAVCRPVSAVSHEPDRISHTPHCASSKGARRIVMKLFIARLRAFGRNEEAQDLIEYALLVGLISLVAVAAITAAGGSVNLIFENIGARLAAAV